MLPMQVTDESVDPLASGGHSSAEAHLANRGTEHAPEGAIVCASSECRTVSSIDGILDAHRPCIPTYLSWHASAFPRTARGIASTTKEEFAMAVQDAERGKRARGKTADAAPAAQEPGNQAQEGAKEFPEQAANMAEMISRAAEMTVQRDRENLELVRRLAETMASGFHAAASEVAEWSRQATERHAEAVRRLTQTRSLDEMLTIQDAYVHDNFQALLDFGAKISQVSAEKATEASRHVRKKKER